MKKLIVYFISILVIFPALAQQANNFTSFGLLQKHIITPHFFEQKQNRTSFTNQWTHNQYKSPNTETMIRFDSIVLVSESGIQKRIIIYNESVINVSDLIQDWSNGAWINNSLISYTYDNNGNLTVMLTQKWDSVAWVNSWLNTFEFDNNGNWLTQLAQGWENGIWMNKVKGIYTYTSNGDLQTELLKGWNTSTWINYLHYTYGYDENRNNISSLLKIWTGEDWLYQVYIKKTFNSLNLVSTSIYKIWSGVQWSRYGKDTYSYDDNNYWLSTLFQEWYDEEWINNGLYSNTYDNYGTRLACLYQAWENDTWVNAERQSYQFVQKKIEAGNYDWDGSNWIESNENKTLELYLGGEFVLSVEAIKMEIYYSDVTGIVEQNAKIENKDLLCYPNPVSDIINIEINPAWQTESCYVELLKPSGCSVKSLEMSFSSQTKTSSIDVADLAPGLYVLQLTSGKSISTQKVIISR